MTRIASSISRFAATCRKNRMRSTRWSDNNGTSYNTKIRTFSFTQRYLLSPYQHQKCVEYFKNFSGLFFISQFQTFLQDTHHRWHKRFKLFLIQQVLATIEICVRYKSLETYNIFLFFRINKFRKFSQQPATKLVSQISDSLSVALNVAYMTVVTRTFKDAASTIETLNISNMEGIWLRNCSPAVSNNVYRMYNPISRILGDS